MEILTKSTLKNKKSHKNIFKLKLERIKIISTFNFSQEIRNFQFIYIPVLHVLRN